jgi:hypothetical protein
VLEVNTSNTPSPQLLSNRRNLKFLLKDKLHVVETQEIPEKPQNDPKDENICKYCLMEDISEDPFENVKLYPCICKIFVHFMCL